MGETRLVHRVLMATFAGLLVLLVAAGLGALQFLAQLHAAELNLRDAALRHTQSLSDLVLSMNLYSDEIQQYLLANRAPAEPDFDQLARQIDRDFQSFPLDRTPDEQDLLSAIDQQIRQHEAIVRDILAWSEAQHRLMAERYLREIVLPARARMQETAGRVALWNQRRLEEASNAQFAAFDALRERLARYLLITIGAGLLLAVGSLAYVMRLDRRSRRNYQDLAESRQQLQQLSARLVDAQETERRTISRELHDQVGQALGALLVDAGRLGALIPPGQPQAHERLNRIKEVAENTVQAVRDIALLLRPSMLDDLGLVAALEWQGREISRRSSDLEVEVEAEEAADRLPDDYRTCIYRLVQEALANAARHSGARNARVRVRQAAGHITVTVEDDGRGFDPQRTRGMGMLGMAERVKRLGGTISFHSAAGQGTRVTAELPLAGAAAPAPMEPAGGTAS